MIDVVFLINFQGEIWCRWFAVHIIYQISKPVNLKINIWTACTLGESSLK